MNDYTIYCTEVQTKKALELGAPIEQTPMLDILRNEIGKRCFLSDNYSLYYFPTTEQMIGWLEGNGIFIEINSHRPDRIIADWRKSLYTFSVVDKFMVICKHCGYSGIEHFPSRKDATIAAIDNALDYLISKKGE